jgi:hypothetical protein
MSNVIVMLDPVERRWEEYVTALKRANTTMSVQDGIAAGKAWREWLNLFMTSDQRNALDSAGRVIG